MTWQEDDVLHKGMMGEGGGGFFFLLQALLRAFHRAYPNSIPPPVRLSLVHVVGGKWWQREERLTRNGGSHLSEVLPPRDNYASVVTGLHSRTAAYRSRRSRRAPRLPVIKEKAEMERYRHVEEGDHKGH